MSAARLIAVVLAVSTVAHADPAEEIRAVRDVGLVIHDGKGHYIAFGTADPATPVSNMSDVIYYGDGKTFYRQPLKGAASNTFHEGQRAWEILDERMGLQLDKSKLEFDKEYKMTCRDNETPLRVLDPKEARKLLAKATFKPVRMDRVAQMLGRDGTTYYLVDSTRRTPTPTDWRVFVGKRGSLKQLKLKDVAADADGQVFTTSSGLLKVNAKTQAMSWEPKPGKQVALSSVPIERNLPLVYGELGVYTNGFGVPCDDL